MKKLNDEQLLHHRSFINGHWHKNQLNFAVNNPATQECVALVDNAGIEEAELAISAAKKALTLWSRQSANERANILRRWFTLVIEHKDDLASIITLEQGKPFAEAVGEITYGASFIEWFAEEGKRIYGDTISAPSNDNRIVVIKQPVGVVGAITPWNFPHAMITRKAAAALAAGCTFVVKPAALTPLSALALAELAQRAGIPDGVFNVIVGQDATGIGKVLTQHPDIAKFTFTGSTAVGKKLLAQCATTVKKVSMELGGNAPFIVFEDADIDAAVAGAIASKFRNAGQTCVCTNRIFVQQGIAELFIEKFRLAVKQLTLGDGFSQEVDMGPMVSIAAADTVHSLVKSSIAAGATLLCGGQRDGQRGSFYQPTVLINVNNEMQIAKHEVFGPVAPIIAFTTEEQAISLANDTKYGLAAYFYARDIGRVWRVAQALDFGMIGINEGVISNAAAPFGGIKQSGNGREGSKYGLDDYVEIKYLCMGGIE